MKYQIRPCFERPIGAKKKNCRESSTLIDPSSSDQPLSPANPLVSKNFVNRPEFLWYPFSPSSPSFSLKRPHLHQKVPATPRVILYEPLFRSIPGKKSHRLTESIRAERMRTTVHTCTPYRYSYPNNALSPTPLNIIWDIKVAQLISKQEEDINSVASTVPHYEIRPQ